MNYTGEALDATLNIPKLDVEDVTGAMDTSLHEIGHLVDAYAGTTSKSFNAITATNKKLIEAVSEGIGSPSQEIIDLFKQNKIDYDEINKTIDISGQLKNINQIYRDNGFASFKDYKKAYNNTFNQLVAKKDYLVRNKFNGENGLQDIYDALSGGLWGDSGKVLYGHGSRYYNSAFSKDKQCSEIFANYFSLSITRPDLVDMLRRDKPKLVEALDELLEEIARGLR